MLILLWDYRYTKPYEPTSAKVNAVGYPVRGHKSNTLPWHAYKHAKMWIVRTLRFLLSLDG
ncbi:MAG: hypothetical protein AB7P18_03105 [Candidatus Binatia bacterium]